MVDYVGELQRKFERLFRNVYTEDEKYKDNLMKEIKELEEEFRAPTVVKENTRFVVNKIQVFERRESPRTLQKISQKIMEDPNLKLQPLVSIGKKITGNLFDRVRFLRERIEELERLIEEREKLHEKLVREMEEDIREREKLLGGVSDPDKIREHKLDISLLKMEKRKEEMLFWRDMLALKKELQELREEYENEKKIASLFDEISLGLGG